MRVEASQPCLPRKSVSHIETEKLSQEKNEPERATFKEATRAIHYSSAHPVVNEAIMVLWTIPVHSKSTTLSIIMYLFCLQLVAGEDEMSDSRRPFRTDGDNVALMSNITPLKVES
jgi:hypothetical protein